jgi:hypothetical protein
MVLKFFR